MVRTKEEEMIRTIDVLMQIRAIEVMGAALSGIKERIGLDFSLVPLEEASDWMRRAVTDLNRQGIISLPFRVRGERDMVMLLGAGVRIHGVFWADGSQLSDDEGKALVDELSMRLAREVPAATGSN